MGTIGYGHFDLKTLLLALEEKVGISSIMARKRVVIAHAHHVDDIQRDQNSVEYPMRKE